MEILKVHFGAQEPKKTQYIPNADGFAEVWLHNNIRTEEDANGNTEFVADGVFFRTMLSEEEVESQRDSYFAESEPETTVADLVEAIDIPTEIVVGGAE